MDRRPDHAELPVPSPGGAPLRDVARAALLPCALACLTLVPFLGKAFTMDDTVFLFEARHALRDPLHPTAFEMTWTYVPERVSAFVPTGPVMAWLLVPTVLAGGSEAVAHTTQLLLVLLAILATVSLALRLGLSRAWAMASGLALAAAPTLLAMAGTAMPDVPAMALGVTGLERLVAWREEGRRHQAVAAAVLLGLAPMTRTHLVLLLGVAALLLVPDPLSPLGWARVPIRRWALLAASAAVAAVVYLATRDPAPQGGQIVGAALALTSTEHLSLNALSLPIHWALASPFALGWSVLRLRAMARRWWVLLAASLAASWPIASLNEPDAPFWLAPVAGLGAAALVDVVLEALRRRDSTWIALAAWMLVPAPAIVYSHLPSKYLLASAPAAALLLARAAAGRRLGRIAIAATAVLGVALGVAILRADAAFAEVGRTGVRLLARPLVAAGRNVWYDGHWGFQWYAEAAGARCWSAAPPQPAPGDFIVSNARRSIPLDEAAFDALVHLRRYEDRRPGGRLMSRAAGAGFYSNVWGLLPWAWGDDLIDAVDLWQAPSGPGTASRPGSVP